MTWWPPPCHWEWPLHPLYLGTQPRSLIGWHRSRDLSTRLWLDKDVSGPSLGLWLREWEALCPIQAPAPSSGECTAVIRKTIAHFWLRLELKFSFVRPFGSNLSGAHNLHLSGSDFQAALLAPSQLSLSSTSALPRLSLSSPFQKTERYQSEP